MKRRWCRSLVCMVGILLGALAYCPDVQGGEPDTFERVFHGVYVGFLGGLAEIEIPGRSLTMEGIEFSDISSSEENAGYRLCAGYWITDNIGFEAGAAYEGTVRASFSYLDRPAERGTGETTITTYGNPFTLQAGLDVKDVRLFARGGIFLWRTEYDTRFDLLDGETQRRRLSRSGSSLIYGAGASWKFKDHWRLRGEIEFMELDIADTRVISLGLEWWL